MGCTTSKPVLETSDNLLRNCKIRRLHVKNAIKHRQEFAAAHMEYIHSLKDVGFALKCFAGGGALETDISSQPSSTPVLALPPPSLSSAGDLSPSRDSDLQANALSPPHSLSRDSGDARSTLPPNISISPPLSPMRLGNQSIPPTGNQSIAPVDSPSMSPHRTSPLVKTPAKTVRTRSLDRSIAPPRSQSFSNIVSPDRGSEFSPPYFSPSRDDLDEALVEYCPPPPSSLITDTTWFNHDVFTPPIIPQHLQEQRRMKRATDSVHKDTHGPGKLEDVEDDIPELEEPDFQGDQSVRDDIDTEASNKRSVKSALTSDRNAPSDDTVSEEVEKRLVLDETVDNSASNIDQDEVVVEKSMLKTSKSSRESLDSQTLGGEAVSKKNPAPMVVLREKTLREVMRYINDFFVEAYQCGHDVSTMLETQVNYQPKLNGRKDSLTSFNSITSHWSRKTSYLGMEDVDEDDDVLECGMSGSHASTLERLYAWERKLYYEVKEGKMLRIAFDRKFKELHILNAKDGDQVQRDRLKATIKKLDMRLLVSLRAIRAASSRVQELTNDELYPQLCELLGGLTIMWRKMAECHQAQTSIALECQTCEDLSVEIEATESHKLATAKLNQTLLKLQTDFQCWVWSHKKYIHELNEWIRWCYAVRDLNEESGKTSRKSSSDWTEKAPVFHLLEAWDSSIVNLNPDTNVSGIKQFTAAMYALEEDQFMEVKSKRQAEKSTRQLSRETVFLNNMDKNNMEGRWVSFKHSPSTLLRIPSKRSLPQKRARLDKYKTRAETQKHNYFTASETRKNTTTDLLQRKLPLLFQSLSSFAKEAESMYEKVKEMAEASGAPDKHKGIARLTLNEHSTTNMLVHVNHDV